MPPPFTNLVVLLYDKDLVLRSGLYSGGKHVQEIEIQNPLRKKICSLSFCCKFPEAMGRRLSHHICISSKQARDIANQNRKSIVYPRSSCNKLEAVSFVFWFTNFHSGMFVITSLSLRHCKLVGNGVIMIACA
jgi:hypothetical protein